MAFSSQPNIPCGQRDDDLQATQKLLRATLDASVDMIQVFEAVRNQQGEIIDFIWLLNNHASEKIYGDVVGKSLLQLQPGVVEEGIFGAFKYVVETGEPRQYEKHYVHEQFDGWFHQSVVKLNDGVVTTTADITLRKRAQEQLQQSQSFLQSVIDSSLDIIQVFRAVRDESGAIVDFVWVMNNHKAVVQNGDVIGKRLLERNPGVVTSGIFDHMVEVVQTGVAFEHEQYYQHEQFDGWFYQALVKTDDGVAMTTRDISRQKQAEREVLRLKDEVAQNATDKYLTLFDAIYQGFALCELIRDEKGQGVDYRILELNPAFETQTGLSRQTQLGRKAREVFPALDPWWTETYTALVDSRAPIAFERYVTEVGRWYEIGAYPMQADQFAVLYNDITERKQREADQELLNRITQELGQLTDETEIIRAVGDKLAAHLGLTCYHYVDIHEDRDLATVRYFWHALEVPALLGTYSLHAFVSPSALADWRAGNPIIINDLERELADGSPEVAVLKAGAAAHKISAYIAVGLSQEGRLKAYFALADSAPRPWKATEIELVQQVARQLLPRLERARAEAALRASQKRFESIVNLVPDLLWESDPDGSTAWYNQQWLTYTGQTFDQAIGWGLVDAIHPDDRQTSAQRYDEAVVAGTLLRQEHRIRRHDGAYRWFAVNALPLKDDNGQVIKMYGAANDFHDRKLIEEALQRREAELARVQQIGQIGGVDVDVANQLIGKRSPEYLRLHGLPSDTQSETHQDWLRRLHPNDRQQAEQTLLSALQSDQSSYESEYRVIRPNDGRVVWIYAKMAIERNAEGKPVRLVGVHIDITARKQAEEALQEADRRKDEFLAMLAHELRNPMSTLRSGLSILDLTLTDELTRSTVRMMDRQTNHLVRMVDDLLDVSRISRGKIELHTERVDLVDLVQQAVEGLQTQFEQQGKSLQVNLPNVGIELEGDATRLIQVVTNLLTNGLRYTGERGTVWLSLKQQDKLAILQVRDNGIGLAADQRSAIFELFVQVDNSLARSKGGLGLGLTLVRRLVEMHKGRVEAQSEGIGKGSTFTVYLPTLTAAEPMAESTPQATASAVADRILVIDDNADAGFTMAMLLKLKGYEVHTRTSGRAGIEAAELLKPRAILLDIGMPEMDGYATCRAIREQPWGQTIAIVALTGYGQDEDRQRTTEAGFNGHLVKPVDLTALLNVLTDLNETNNKRYE